MALLDSISKGNLFGMSPKPSARLAELGNKEKAYDLIKRAARCR
jgi:hypothetical protein